MQKYWLPWLVGMPAEVSLAICSMIFGGVFEKLPKLRVCFAHGGGAFTGTVGRIAHGYTSRPDLCGVDNDVNPREYLGRFFVALGEAEPGKLIETADWMSDGLRTRLLTTNALEWLGRTAAEFGLNGVELAINVDK
jgi:aminocarboxymuconate-semialdehyde decarboxylase